MNEFPIRAFAVVALDDRNELPLKLALLELPRRAVFNNGLLCRGSLFSFDSPAHNQLSNNSSLFQVRCIVQKAKFENPRN